MRQLDLLYVAGPYTRPDPVINTHGACKFATAIYEAGLWTPMVPHITLVWHAITPRPINFWYALDLAHMSRCDAIVRLPGDSTGADAEVAYAREIDLPIIPFESFPKDMRALWLERGA